MLAATWLSACGMLATAPGLQPMRISEDEAKTLGQAWAAYIESFPGAKRHAALKMVQTIMPSIIAFGTTTLIFLPRVQLMQAMAQQRPQRPPTTEPTIPPPWRAAQPPPVEGPSPGAPSREERRDIIDGMDL